MSSLTFLQRREHLELLGGDSQETPILLVMGTLVGNNPPDTPGGVEGLEESPRAAGMAKGPQPHVWNFFTESQPWDSIVSVTARPS